MAAKRGLNRVRSDSYQKGRTGLPASGQVVFIQAPSFYFLKGIFGHAQQEFQFKGLGKIIVKAGFSALHQAEKIRMSMGIKSVPFVGK